MKVLNVHRRDLHFPIEQVSRIVASLATDEDRFWPHENWPKMRFKNGLKVGERGGHGPIRYHLEKYESGILYEFRFAVPKGFDGIHRLEVSDQGGQVTCVKHAIEMTTSGKGTLYWIFAIRSLHDALLEDALDKLENQLANTIKSTKWSFWVKVLRKVLK